MIHASIPGFDDYHLEELILDYNRTLAIDGRLLPGVRVKIGLLAKSLRIHVLTADTFGSATKELRNLPCKLTVIAPIPSAQNKSKLRDEVLDLPPHKRGRQVLR